jgi:hypothetical protein
MNRLSPWLGGLGIDSGHTIRVANTDEEKGIIRVTESVRSLDEYIVRQESVHLDK